MYISIYTDMYICTYMYIHMYVFDMGNHVGCLGGPGNSNTEALLFYVGPWGSRSALGSSSVGFRLSGT